MRYRIDDWTCTVSGTVSMLILTYDGNVTMRHLDRFTESVVRALEEEVGEQLDWATADGHRYRQSDVATGDVISPTLEA